MDIFRDLSSPSMGSALIVSDARNGVTWFLQKFVQRAQTSDRRMLLVSLPPNCDLLKFRNLIYKAANPFLWSADSPAYIRHYQSNQDFVQSNIVAVVIDDGEHLLHLSREKRSVFCQGLVDLARELEVPLALAVPVKLAEEISGGYDPKMQEQLLHQRTFLRKHAFRPFYLPKLRVDEDFVDLLDLWERTLPLKEVSHLARRDLALHLYAISDGRYGTLTSVLRRAAAAAIINNSERITPALLDDLGFGAAQTFRGFRF